MVETRISNSKRMSKIEILPRWARGEVLVWKTKQNTKHNLFYSKFEEEIALKAIRKCRLA